MEITKVSSKGKNIHLDISENTITKILLRASNYNKATEKSKILVFVIFMLLMASAGLTTINHLFPSRFWPGAFMISGILIAIFTCYIISDFNKTNIYYLSLFLKDIWLDQTSGNYKDSFRYLFNREVGRYNIDRYLDFYEDGCHIWQIECNVVNLTKYIDTDLKDILVEITINKRGTKAYVAVYIPDT